MQRYRNEVSLDNLLYRIETKKLQRPTINHIRRQFLDEDIEENEKQKQVIYRRHVLKKKEGEEQMKKTFKLPLKIKLDEIIQNFYLKIVLKVQQGILVAFFLLLKIKQ